jgi:hypothetical protein
MIAPQHHQTRPRTRLFSRVQAVGTTRVQAVGTIGILTGLLAAIPAWGSKDGICYQSHDPQRGVVYFYCPEDKTYVVKQDPQTGKFYEKQGAGSWHPLDPRGKSRGK